MRGPFTGFSRVGSILGATGNAYYLEPGRADTIVYPWSHSKVLEAAEAVYKTDMKKVHPDKGGTNDQACRLTHAIEVIRGGVRER